MRRGDRTRQSRPPGVRRARSQGGDVRVGRRSGAPSAAQSPGGSDRWGRGNWPAQGCCRPFSRPSGSPSNRRGHMLSATRVLVLLALGCTVATSSVSAQTRRSLRFGFGLGAAAPQGDFKEDATGEGFDPGWHAIGYLEFAPSRTPFGLRMEVTFTRNPANQQLKDDIEAELGPGFEASMRTVGGNASATWTIPLTPRTKGYLIGGDRVRHPRVDHQLRRRERGHVADQLRLECGRGPDLPAHSRDDVRRVPILQDRDHLRIRQPPVRRGDSGYPLGTLAGRRSTFGRPRLGCGHRRGRG